MADITESIEGWIAVVPSLNLRFRLANEGDDVAAVALADLQGTNRSPGADRDEMRLVYTAPGEQRHDRPHDHEPQPRSAAHVAGHPATLAPK
jgi:hypothetical protein